MKARLARSDQREVNGARAVDDRWTDFNIIANIRGVILLLRRAQWTEDITEIVGIASAHVRYILNYSSRSTLVSMFPERVSARGNERTKNN